MNCLRVSLVIIISILLLCCCNGSEDVNYRKEVSKQNDEISQLKNILEEDKKLINNYEMDIRVKTSELQDYYTDTYDQSMIEEELKRSKYVIRLYDNEFKRIQEVSDINIDQKILNLIQPENIKMGDVIAGLVVTDASSNEYGYEYNIEFDGEFTVKVILEYNPMFEQFFGKTEDLDMIPYVSQFNLSTTFLINDPNEILFNAKDGDIITATFDKYKVRRINGKPFPDVATINAIE